MSRPFFFELKEFDDSHDANLALHYAHILMCVQKGMMYNIDTTERVAKRVFERKLAEGAIGEYSDNPNHPVYGDLTEYQNGLGEEVVKFGQELNLLVSNLIFTIENLEEGLSEFAQALYFVTPELLLALKTHPHFRPIMSRRELWEELLRFSARMNDEDVKIPAYFHIDRYYVDLLLNPDHDHVENLPTSTSDLEMESVAISIANEQEFGAPATISLRRGREVHRYTITLGREVGYEVKKLE
jgi:hypothetical protein